MGAKNNSLWREGRGERGANPLGEAVFLVKMPEAPVCKITKGGKRLDKQYHSVILFFGAGGPLQCYEEETSSNIKSDF